MIIIWASCDIGRGFVRLGPGQFSTEVYDIANILLIPYWLLWSKVNGRSMACLSQMGATVDMNNGPILVTLPFGFTVTESKNNSPTMSQVQ